MKRKADCPQCQTTIRIPYEKEIIPNRQLEQQIDVYRECRDPMRASLVRLDVLEKEKATTTSQKGTKRSAEEVMDSNGNDELNGMSKRAQRAVARCEVHSSLGSDDVMEDDNESDGDCNELPQQQQQQQHVLKRKPTISYHNMNKKKLIDICQREGLSTVGNETELRHRHSDYITLFNSECDSYHPRSVKELRTEIKNREMSIKREAGQAGPKQQYTLLQQLAYSVEARNGGSIDKLTTSNVAFDTKLNTKYAELIASVKKRDTRRTTTTTTSKEDTVIEHDISLAQNVSVEQKGNYKCLHDTPSLENHLDDDVRLACASKCQPLDVDGGSQCNGKISPSVTLTYDKMKMAEKKSDLATTNSTEKCASSNKATNKLKSNPTTTATTTTIAPGTRIQNLGPWICDACTYNNVRNITRNSRCEMCNTVRSRVLDSDQRCSSSAATTMNDVEIVNIDC